MNPRDIDVEVVLWNIDRYKYDQMEIRADLILTREKLARLYVETDNEAMLPILGDLHRAIEAIKRL